MTTKAEILAAIRGKCLSCCNESWKEVELCTVEKCILYPFRFGKDPTPAKGGKRLPGKKLAPAHVGLISKKKN